MAVGRPLGAGPQGRPLSRRVNADLADRDGSHGLLHDRAGLRAHTLGTATPKVFSCWEGWVHGAQLLRRTIRAIRLDPYHPRSPSSVEPALRPLREWPARRPWLERREADVRSAGRRRGHVDP